MAIRPGAFVNSVRVWLLSMPLTTRIILSFIAIAYPLNYSFGCLNPSLVIFSFQVHRIVTYAICHYDLLHLLFNLVSFLSIARRMERDMGSTRFGCTIVLLSNTVALLYITATIIGHFGLREWSGFESCVCGFSGVLFALLVIFVYQYAVTETIHLFGLIPVPSTAYPWVLLVLFQFLPRVSFLCHACGILTGFAFVHGFMSPVQMSTASILAIERWIIVRTLVSYNGFVPCTESRLPVSTADSAPEASAAPPAPSQVVASDSSEI